MALPCPRLPELVGGRPRDARELAQPLWVVAHAVRRRVDHAVERRIKLDGGAVAVAVHMAPHSVGELAMGHGRDFVAGLCGEQVLGRRPRV
jgi:hypothetical protein